MRTTKAPDALDRVPACDTARNPTDGAIANGPKVICAIGAPRGNASAEKFLTANV